MAEDYYKILGVSRGASAEEIQKAYRDKARKYHPDVNPDDKQAREKFKQVQKAFEVLNDSKKRRLYDQFGSSYEAAEKSGFHPGAGFSGGWGPGGGQAGARGGARGGTPYEFDFSELFGGGGGGGRRGGGKGGFADFFSQFRQAPAAEPGPSKEAQWKGQDIHHDLTVPFTTSVTGGSAQITVRRQNGKTETITVKIPKGIADGKKIRLRGQGEASPYGGPVGDIILTIHVTPHPCFERRDNHLHLRLPVTLGEAAGGAKVDVPTPNGTVTLQIPPGTSSGKRLRVKGHGIPHKDGAGDLYVEVRIVLPPKLDDDAIEKLKSLDAAYTDEPREKVHW